MKFSSRLRPFLLVLVGLAVAGWGWVAPASQLLIGYGVLVAAAVVAVTLMARHGHHGQAGPDGGGGPGDDGPDERKPLGDGPDAVDVELWAMIDREQSAAGGLA